MPFVELNLKSLDDLDGGRVSKAFQHEIKRATADCMDRPNDKGKRKVVLELELTPIAENRDGIIECEGASGEFKIKSSVPQRKSKTYSFRTTKQGHLAYSSESPENADQTTIFEADKSGHVADRGLNQA